MRQGTLRCFWGYNLYSTVHYIPPPSSLTAAGTLHEARGPTGGPQGQPGLRTETEERKCRAKIKVREWDEEMCVCVVCKCIPWLYVGWWSMRSF